MIRASLELRATNVALKAPNSQKSRSQPEPNGSQTLPPKFLRAAQSLPLVCFGIVVLVSFFKVHVFIDFRCHQKRNIMVWAGGVVHMAEV